MQHPFDEDAPCSHIDNIFDYVLEHIFIYVNPYQDFSNVLLVNKRWNRVGKTTLARMKRLFYKCNNFAWRLLEDDSHLLSERCSHAACYYPPRSAMFMFGGCTSTYTAFNDLWLFDLSNRKWGRILISRSPLPSAKALATLVRYRDNLILYGGFSKSSTNPIHQTTTFYKEIHLYNISNSCWEAIICENTAPHLAGHTASIVGDFMLVFGGSMGSSYNNNVYVLDITRRIWNVPFIPGPCPPPRYGQSQILLDDRHLVIIGGCGGPSVMFCDVWLLDFDLCGDTEWKWTQLKVENLDLCPPYLWCHQACKVGLNAVVLSRPTKFCIKRSRRRRASSQLSNSASSAQMSSPDSPQDRRAVAAAFCGTALPTQSLASTTDGEPSDGTLAANAKRKPTLLSSRSLDDEDRCDLGRSVSASTTGHSTSDGTTAASAAGQVGTSRLLIAKSAELHRACSIPAIIVGEIPKLIVTASTDHHHNINSGQLSYTRFPAFNTACEDGKATTSGSSSLPPSGDERSNKYSSSTSKKFTVSPSLNCKTGYESSIDEASKYGHTDAVHAFYLSLLKEEHDRLKIVELNGNLKMEERLCAFLKERVPYLSMQNRLDMVAELLDVTRRPYSRSRTDLCTATSSQPAQGRLSNARSRDSASIDNDAPGTSAGRIAGGRSSIGGASVSSSNASLHRTSLTDASSNIFGQNYYRHMCAYVLRLQNAIDGQVVRWEQLSVEEDSPEDIILHTVVAARGELILFGGMHSDGGNGMDCLNVSMERHSMNADTFILRPRYNEM